MELSYLVLEQPEEQVVWGGYAKRGVWGRLGQEGLKALWYGTVSLWVALEARSGAHSTAHSP